MTAPIKPPVAILHAEKVGIPWSPGTMLTDAKGQFVVTLFHVAKEGEIWKRNPQDAGYRITWVGSAELFEAA